LLPLFIPFVSYSASADSLVRKILTYLFLLTYVRSLFVLHWRHNEAQ